MKLLRHSLRAALFLLPLVLFFSIPALTLWLSGEWMNSDDVRQRQSETPGRVVLHGPAFSNRVIYQKTRFMLERHPQVVALGTSRVLQFRSGFFLPEVRFVNGGSCIQRVVHFRQLLATLPEAQQPQVLLLGLDPYWFNGKSGYANNHVRGTDWFEEQRTQSFDRAEMLRQNWWTIDRDLLTGSIPLTRLFSRDGRRERIGLSALVWDEGTRSDGSFKYRPYLFDLNDPRHMDRRFEATFRRISVGELPYEYGDELDSANVQEIANLLSECTRRGIMVIGFLPPYPHVVVERMAALGDRYRYLSRLDPALRPLFEGRGFEFYDFTDAGKLGSADDEAIDGFHGSERTYLRVLASMLRQGSFLNVYANLPDVEKVLEHAKANTELVPDRF